jgi:heme exporter protein CcmD
MSLSSPYLIYILGAYGLSFIALSVFLSWTFIQWRRSTRELENVSRET